MKIINKIKMEIDWIKMFKGYYTKYFSIAKCIVPASGITKGINGKGLYIFCKNISIRIGKAL